MDRVALETHHEPMAQQPEPVVVSAHDVLPIATTLTEPLATMTQQFWNLPFAFKFFSASATPHYYWHVQDFYVVQKGLDKEGTRWAQLRLSESFCQFMFEKTLGKSPDEHPFSLNDIREFEVFLIERFSRKLFNFLSPELFKRPGKPSPPAHNEPLMHLVWSIHADPEETGHMIITVPHSCLKTEVSEPSEPRQWHIPESVFDHAHTQVLFNIGSTKAKLDELQQLEAGDIVLLENSNTTAWHVLDSTAQRWLKIPINVPENRDLSSLIPIQGLDAMTNELDMKQTIWDNLQVDVTASFLPTKMPLKQLKEMTEGWLSKWEN